MKLSMKLSKLNWAEILLYVILAFMLLKAFGIIDPPDTSAWQTGSALGAMMAVLFWGIKSALKSAKNEFKSELSELKVDFHKTFRESIGDISDRLSKLEGEHEAITKSKSHK